MPFFFGDFQAYKTYYRNTTGTSLPDFLLWGLFTRVTYVEFAKVIYFASAVIKSIIYPITFLLQILCLIYLIRGNSGYSRSARNWFIMAVSADIASFVYLLYELLSQDWQYTNPFVDEESQPAVVFMALMWGLRSADHAQIQNVMCKAFFAIIYFPIYLSPIALTMSSLIRSYSVKFPLRAKAVITKFKERVLMIMVVIISLAISITIAVLAVVGTSHTEKGAFDVLGIQIFDAFCRIPVVRFVDRNSLLQGGYIFMMVVGFIISGLNMMSAGVTVWVLFDARRSRKSMSASVREDSNSEVRATMKLLGINLVIFMCFFLSRLFTLLQYLYDPAEVRTIGVSHLVIIRELIFDRLGSYLFVVPYCINWLFITGFDRKFYGFFLRCFGSLLSVNYSVQSKTAQESVAG